MNQKELVVAWMKDLKSAWEQHDISKILLLFEDTNEYFEGPFSKPVSTAEEIEGLWEEIEFQRIEKLDIDLIALEEGNSAMHWYLKYVDTRDEQLYEMDGAYEVHFNEKGKCTYFKQWWVMAY